ncbi:hypothetical protein [Conexibacter woesei]|uniref:hypothetical protein n=1 Tax=Conexibacter woesei TaxID=191495 RepID=UPI0012DCCF04|nr:hypothetical protein [Conexibacter woesei]
MDNTLAAAVIAGLTSLGATALGGRISLKATQSSSEMQREREQQAATRLVLSELRTNGRALREALRRADLTGLIQGPPSVRQWERHQFALAVELSHDDWYIVDRAAASMAGVHHIVTQRDASPSLENEWHRHFDRFLRETVIALGVLRASLDGDARDVATLGLAVLDDRVDEAQRPHLSAAQRARRRHRRER